MIALVVVAGVVLFAVWRIRKRAKAKGLVAGLVPERPAFTVAPPAGRLGRMKDGSL